MELANYIETAMKSILKKSNLRSVIRNKITKILKQSNFVKRGWISTISNNFTLSLYAYYAKKDNQLFIKIVIRLMVKMYIIDLSKKKRYNWRKLFFIVKCYRNFKR